MSISQIIFTLFFVIIYFPNYYFCVFKHSQIGGRLVMVLERGSYITWTWSHEVRVSCSKH